MTCGRMVRWLPTGCFEDAPRRRATAGGFPELTLWPEQPHGHLPYLSGFKVPFPLTTPICATPLIFKDNKSKTQGAARHGLISSRGWAAQVCWSVRTTATGHHAWTLTVSRVEATGQGKVSVGLASSEAVRDYLPQALLQLLVVSGDPWCVLAYRSITPSPPRSPHILPMWPPVSKRLFYKDTTQNGLGSACTRTARHNG